jgi:hypothetical protein
LRVLRRIALSIMLWDVSRGPTRRVQRLALSGAVSEQLIALADHEADLLAHPYIGTEHLHLAQLRFEGRTPERDALLAKIAPGIRRRWWRPRGARSALRRRGLAETEARRAAAKHVEAYCTEMSRDDAAS